MVMHLLKTKISLLNNVSSTLKDESKNLVSPMNKSSGDDKQAICGQSSYWYWNIIWIAGLSKLYGTCIIFKLTSNTFLKLQK